MAIGRTFSESLRRRCAASSRTAHGFDCGSGPTPGGRRARGGARATPPPAPVARGPQALRHGVPVETIAERSRIDPWFLHHMRSDIACEQRGRRRRRGTVARRRPPAPGQAPGLLRPAARLPGGCSRGGRASPAAPAGIRPVFKRVDTCAAEFEAHTPYLYSTYEDEDEADASDRKKVVILGGGPNRIGQGIEFDYCCVHACLRPARGRVRDHHGQLQPGDGLHRLRHLRPALLRAPDPRARARAARSSASGSRDGRHRPVRRARPRSSWPWRSRRPACRSSGPRADVDRPGRGPRAVRRADREAEV